MSNPLNEKQSSAFRLFFPLNSHRWFGDSRKDAARPPSSRLNQLGGGDGLIKAFIVSFNTGTAHTHSDGDIRMLLIRSSGSGVEKRMEVHVYNIQGWCALETVPLTARKKKIHK